MLREDDYQKWAGLMWLCLDWEDEGSRIKAFPRSVLRSPEFYFKYGLTYTLMALGSFGARILNKALFDVTGTSIFSITNTMSLPSIAALTSSHVASYILRITTQDLKFNGGYVSNLPLPQSAQLDIFDLVGKACISLKNILVCQDPIEQSFVNMLNEHSIRVQTALHSLEGLNEQLVSKAYELDIQDIQAVLEETGTPAGWYPLINGYDALPTIPADYDLPPLPQELLDYLTTHEHITPIDKELTRIKANLRMLYEAGPGAKNVEQEETDEPTEDNEGEEEIASGAHIPIPTETFLEELSVKMQLHPISVYWLLEELKAEGARCKPEELRLLEDRLSVLILRLLGHRWPKQLEVGEPIPAWASSDGIIPLVSGDRRVNAGRAGTHTVAS